VSRRKLPGVVENAPTPTEMADGRRRTIAQYLSTPFRSAGEFLRQRAGFCPSAPVSTGETPRRGHGAIRRVEDDRLRRELLAYDLAVRLDSPPADEGYVLGLTGPWGSGKSSLMNLVALHVAPDDIVVRFNPWLYSDTTELVNRFLTDVRKALPRWRNWRVRGSLARYAGALEPLGRLGFLTPGMPIAAAAGGLVRRLIGGARTPEQEREVVRKALLRLKGRRLIVLVDDMDRLAPPEVVEMVRLMKLVGDFPRTSYLVAYDRTHVEHALKTIHGEQSSGRAYLEKIVQSTQLVPHVEARTLSALLVEELEAAVAEALGGPLSDMPRWATVQVHVLTPLVRTVRDIRRYVEVASAALSVNGKDVDPVDVLGLEAIRLFAPDIHDAIAPEAVLLTQLGFRLAYLQETQPGKDRLEAWLDAIDSDHRPLAKNMLRHFFPTAHAHLGDERPKDDERSDWVRERRVATLDGLLTYLTNTVGEDVVDWELTEQARRAVTDPEAFRSVVEPLSEVRLRDLMGRLNAAEVELNPATAAGAVAVLFGRVMTFKLETRTAIQPAVETYILPLAEQLLLSIPEGDRDRAAEQVFAALRHPYERFLFLRYFGNFPMARGDRPDGSTGKADAPAVTTSTRARRPSYFSVAVSSRLRGAVHQQVVSASAEEIMEWGRPREMLDVLFDVDRQEGRARLLELFEGDDFALYLLASLTHWEVDRTREPEDLAVTSGYDGLASLVGRDALDRRILRLEKSRPIADLEPDAATALALALVHLEGQGPTDA
jgi:hypothetical protein